MLSTEISWVDEFLKTDDEVIGVYIALTYLGEEYFVGSIHENRGSEILRKARDAYFKLMELGIDHAKAFEAATRFVDKLVEMYGDNFLKNCDFRKKLLENIHNSYFKRFLSSYTKFLNLKAIDSSDRDIVVRLLKDIRAGLVDTDFRPPSAVIVYPYHLDLHLRNAYKLDEASVKRVVNEMIKSNIILYSSYKHIFPSVAFTSEVLELIASGKRAEEARVEAAAKPEAAKPMPGQVPDRFRARPSREVLESIVAYALSSLGFNVRVDARLPSRTGSFIEVDVWGEKRVGDARFTVYVSCKNWDRDVDRSVVDEEYGRTNNLREIPHLRILVARRLTDPARETAIADGFIVIELGEKASAETAEDIYRLVYLKLRELFIGIAPPDLQKLALEVKDIAENLRKIAESLERISK